MKSTHHVDRGGIEHAPTPALTQVPIPGPGAHTCLEALCVLQVVQQPPRGGRQHGHTLTQPRLFVGPVLPANQQAGHQPPEAAQQLHAHVVDLYAQLPGGADDDGVRALPAGYARLLGLGRQ